MKNTTRTASPDEGIHSRAMLVRLSIKCWDGRRFDRTITDEVNTAHAASKDAGRYNKQLLGGKQNAPEHAAAVTKAGAARQTFYGQTLPWADEGWRLLPTANYEKFTDAMRAARGEFDETVETFIAAYPDLKAKARTLLNGMYREEDYPTPEALRGRFHFEIEFMPVPSAGDFRLDLPADQLAEIESRTESRVERATKEAMAEAWDRLRESVEKVRERLSNPKNVFRDSLIGNVQELADVLTRLNVTGDADLEAMRNRVADEIASLTPDELRKNTKLRAETAKSAADILDTMKGLYGAQ